MFYPGNAGNKNVWDVSTHLTRLHGVTDKETVVFIPTEPRLETLLRNPWQSLGRKTGSYSTGEGLWKEMVHDQETLGTLKEGDCNYCLTCNDMTPFILAGLREVLWDPVTLSSGETDLHDHLNKGHDHFLCLLCRIVSVLTKTKLYPWLPANHIKKAFWGTRGKIQHILNFMTIWERLIRFIPRPLYLRKTWSDILRIETWTGSAFDVDDLEQIICRFLWIKPRFLHRSS